MKKGRIALLALGFTLLVFSGSQAQEKYPGHPIELVVPFAPGGNADVIARIYSEELARVLKVPVNVVNRAGGTGIQGTTYVVRAKKDGYTLLGSTGTPLTIMFAISSEVTYNPLKDLIHLGQIASVPSLFVVKIDSPFKTLDELIEYARKNPGKLKNCAAGLGAESQFNLEILCAHNKIKITTVPFKSGGEALPALLGGHVDMASLSLATLGPQINAGKLRGLAISSKARHPDFPNIPTTAELGHPYVNLRIWSGIFAPVGVPQSVLDVLVPAVEKVFKHPDIVDRATKAGFTMEYKAPEELRKFIESEIKILEKVAQDAGLAKK